MLSKFFKKKKLIIILSVLGSIGLITIPIIIYVNQQSQKPKFIPPELMQVKVINEYKLSKESKYGHTPIPMLKVEYTAYRFNYIDPALCPPLKDYVGSERHVAKYVQNKPFNNWYDIFTNKFHPSFSKAGLGRCLFNTLDYDFDVEISKKNHTITIKVNCPEYLLKQDKDYYIGEILLPTNWMDETNYFPLHFNPVKRTLSLYESPQNSKEE